MLDNEHGWAFLNQRAEGVAYGVPYVVVGVDELRQHVLGARIGLVSPEAGFFQRRLFRQRYVCLFRKGHPLDRKRLTLADFKAAEHLVIVSAGTGHGKIDDLIRRAGVDRTVRLKVPHFVSVGHLLQRTDMVATVTERLAESLVEPFELTYRPHPIDLPEIAINVFWHAKVHRSPAHQWLRGVVFDLFGDSTDKAPLPLSPKSRLT